MNEPLDGDQRGPPEAVGSPGGHRDLRMFIKTYAESFLSEDHLKKVQADVQTQVGCLFKKT
jgi:hypothetical protein